MAYHLAVLVPLPSGQWRTDIPDFPGCNAEHSSALTAMSRAHECAEAMATKIVRKGEGLPRSRDLQSVIADQSWREGPDIDWKTAVILVLDVRAPRRQRMSACEAPDDWPQARPRTG